MENLIITEKPDNYSGSTVPAIKSGSVITNEKGEFVVTQTLPTPVQKNIEAENLKFKDSTVNNSSESKHGFLPKLSGQAEEYLDGEGNWVKPPRGGQGFANIWWVESDETVTIGASYENVVSNMVIDGALVIDGRLTIGI